VARVSIKRLELSAMVREGVSAKTLSTSVGHIPATALPGAEGNFAIAAHRDTLFRALKNIRLGDEVTVESRSQRYVYEVVATKIVKPSDVSVLRADGGGLYAAADDGTKPERLLTMITCYPFYYVGSAPKRFIVESRLVSSSPLS
jgi:sortase A